MGFDLIGALLPKFTLVKAHYHKQHEKAEADAHNKRKEIQRQRRKDGLCDLPESELRRMVPVPPKYHPPERSAGEIFMNNWTPVMPREYHGHTAYDRNRYGGGHRGHGGFGGFGGQGHHGGQGGFAPFSGPQRHPSHRGPGGGHAPPLRRSHSHDGLHRRNSHGRAGPMTPGVSLNFGGQFTGRSNRPNPNSYPSRFHQQWGSHHRRR